MQNIHKRAVGNNFSRIPMPEVFMENMTEVKYSL
jgi:hypothetical protein